MQIQTVCCACSECLMAAFVEEDLISEQQQDVEQGKIHLSEHLAWSTQDRLLQYANEYHHKPIYVPEALRERLLQLAHGNPLAGHVRAHKVYAALKIMYHWPGMKADVRRFVRSCDVCQFFDIPTTKAPGLLQSLQISRLFETMALDFVGGFPPTFKGNTHILISVDLFSKYVVAIATKDMTSRDCCHILAV